jgi:hypothetical protein
LRSGCLVRGGCGNARQTRDGTGQKRSSIHAGVLSHASPSSRFSRMRGRESGRSASVRSGRLICTNRRRPMVISLRREKLAGAHLLNRNPVFSSFGHSPAELYSICQARQSSVSDSVTCRAVSRNTSNADASTNCDYYAGGAKRMFGEEQT